FPYTTLFRSDVHDAEALRVAERPLEVIEQRPHEVAAQVHSLLRGRTRRLEVLAQVRDAQRILEAVARDRRGIEEGRAVLGHIERHLAIALSDPEQDVAEALGVDLPARFGV